MSKKRKIIAVSEDARYFNLDVRVSIPKTQISQELIDDLLVAQHELVNNSGNQVFYAKVNEDENGNDKIEIGNSYFYGVE
jgi:hypothetical protein